MKTEQQINEELRQFKLFKIQETESKIRKFSQAYTEIKQLYLIKFSKNAGSSILRLAINLAGIALFFISLVCFFPEQLIPFFENEGETLNTLEKQEITQVLMTLKYITLGTAIICFFISYLLKKNNQKRTTIYSLSKLLEEVMTYMETSSAEEKRRYEYFMDNLAAQEAVKQEALENK